MSRFSINFLIQHLITKKKELLSTFYFRSPFRDFSQSFDSEKRTSREKNVGEQRQWREREKQ